MFALTPGGFIRLIRGIVGSSVVVIVVMACGSDGISAPPAGFTHALAQGACGPADGPAVAIYLTRDAAESPPPATPFVRIYIAQAVDQLPGHAWSIAGSDSQGGAWFEPTSNTSELATGGFVIVNSVGADNTIAGSVDLIFPKAGRVRGGFRAPLFPNNFLCG